MTSVIGGAVVAGAPAANTNTEQPTSAQGIVVAIGPVDRQIPGAVTNTTLKFWTAFHVTPERIGPAGSSTWSANQVVQGAALPVYTGYQASKISWVGRLEPPRIYLPASGRDYAERFEQQFGVKLEPGENQNWRVSQPVTLEPALLSAYGFAAPSDPGGASGVVMESGAQVVGYYIEPHAYAAMLDIMLAAGEVFRLAVGDQYGWNRLVHLVQWEWYYEDADPDVLNYTIECEEHLYNPILQASPVPKAPKGFYDIKPGDTLHSIAHTVYSRSSDWPKLVKLNQRYLEKFWIHPEPKNRIAYTYGVKKLEPLEHQIRIKGKTFTGINPSAQFQGGGRLRVSVPKTKKKKK